MHLGVGLVDEGELAVGALLGGVLELVLLQVLVEVLRQAPPARFGEVHLEHAQAVQAHDVRGAVVPL